MVGGPSQMDLFDYKPKMAGGMTRIAGFRPPERRLTTMTSGQARFPIAPSKYRFSQVGSAGMWMNTELLPYGEVRGRHVLHPVHAHRGHQPRAGHLPHADGQHEFRPTLHRFLGQLWPGFHGMKISPRLSCWWRSRPTKEQIQTISARLWSSGYLPGEHAGVSFQERG